MKSTLIRPLLLLAAAALGQSCSLLTSSGLEAGVGEPCAADDECQGSGAVCDSGVCALPCAASSDCPASSTCVEELCRAGGARAFGAACQASSECASSLCATGICTSACQKDGDCENGATCAASLCQPIVKAGFLFDAQVTGATSGFAHTHDLGRREAEAELPWLQTFIAEGQTSSTVNAGLSDLLDKGMDVIFVTSSIFATEASAKAASHPDTKFFTFAAPSTANDVGYDARYHQAWYIAGFVAGTFDAAVTKSGRIGFVGPLAIPETVRQLNAFTRGVRSAAPQATVEIAWANSFDPSDAVAKKLVDYLVTGGAKIIVNRLGTSVVVDYVDSLAQTSPLYAIGRDDKDACAKTPKTCLGAPYWNWGRLYTRLLRQVHDGSFDPAVVINDSIQPDPAESSFHFALNDANVPQLASISMQVANQVTKVVGPNGEDTSLRGPYCVTRADQRSPECVAAGEDIGDAELQSMCWLVDGVVQPSNTEDPTSALVPAAAPDGTVIWPPQSVDPTSIARPSCK